MADSISAIGAIPAQARQQTSTGYDTAREVDRQARAARTNDGPELKAAAEKIDRLLTSGKPLRDDVPRGFYLNVEI